MSAQRAENLKLDVSYVRGWQNAKRGTSALAEQLRALGLESDVPGLKADVNVDGVVCLGIESSPSSNMQVGSSGVALARDTHADLGRESAVLITRHVIGRG